jgi:hypothetical protein
VITSAPRRTRRPACVTTRWSARVRTRDAAGSTTLRRKARGGPCADERSGWLARHAYACASETHASSPDGDCWAETCACSRTTPVKRRCEGCFGTRQKPWHGRPSTVRGAAYPVKRPGTPERARSPIANAAHCYVRLPEKKYSERLWTTRRRERSGAASVGPSPTSTSAVKSFTSRPWAVSTACE